MEVVGKKDGWLGFDTLTMIPIQRELIDVKLLDESEVKWINSYHEKVWNNVGALLDDGSSEKEWLRRFTRPLEN